MNRLKMSVPIVLCILLLLFVVPAFAQEPEVATCVSPVSGTVVGVNASTGLVTVGLADGTQCTVTLGQGSYNHPVVALLGQYFDDVSAEALAGALAALQRCALPFPEGSWTLVSCDTPGRVEVTVTGANPDGSFSAVLNGTDPVQQITILVDTDTAEDLEDNLESLVVHWELDEFGEVLEAGDRISAYHDEGIGFGVLVKLFAIAKESQEACAAEGAVADPTCGVTVEELVAAIQVDGLGMGELFKLYGKPSMLGVGHVRHNADGEKGKPAWAGPKDKDKDKDAEEGLDPSGDSGQDEGQGGRKNGPPDHANGNKDKDKDKDKEKNRGGPPAHAGPPAGKGKH